MSIEVINKNIGLSNYIYIVELSQFFKCSIRTLLNTK